MLLWSAHIRSVLPRAIGVALLVVLGVSPWAFAIGDHNFELGVRAFEQGKTKAALQYFVEAQRLHPEDGRIANALGNAWFVLNQPTKAQEEYRRAIQLDPGLAAAYKNLGILEYQQKHYAAAIPELDAAKNKAPRDAVSWRFLGLALRSLGKKAEAGQCLHRSLSLDPDSAKTRLALAETEAELKQNTAALANYRELMLDGSLDADSQRAIGLGLLQLGDAAEAEQQLAFVRGHSLAADEELELAQAQAQAAAHQFDAAVGTLTQALATAKDKARVYDMLGWVEEQNHHPNQAAGDYRSAIMADPQRAEPYLQLSWLYTEHRHFEEAEKTLREGLRFVKTPYPLTVQLGTILALGGREQSAADILEGAVRQSPNDPFAYTTLIIADTLLDPSYKQPLAAAEAALRTCPHNYLVHYLYAGLLLRQHRKDFAEPGGERIIARVKSELRKSIRLNPDFPHSHYDLARTDFDTGEYRAAESEAQAALHADSTFLSARYLLGRIYLKEGRRKEGLAEIAQVDQQHREEMHRIETVGQALLAEQAAGGNVRQGAAGTSEVPK